MPLDTTPPFPSGILPVLAMPFSADGSVNVADLRREVAWAIGCGIHGLVLGRASELPRLTETERRDVISLVADETAGRIPIVALASHESTAAALLLARTAAENGADALLVSPPTFEISGEATAEAFFCELLASTSLPIVLQDIPEARIDHRLVKRLADRFPHRLSLKVEVPPTHLAVTQALETTGGRVPIIGGAAGISLLSELQRGARGTMPGCVCPDLFVEVWNLHQLGDESGARSAFHRLLPILVATSQPTRLLVSYREALVMRGIFRSATSREPGIPLDPTDLIELRKLLEELDLTDPRAAVGPAS